MRTICVANGLTIKLKLRCCKADLAAFSFCENNTCLCCSVGVVETPTHHIMCPAWESHRSQLLGQLSVLSSSHNDSLLPSVVSLLFNRNSLLPTFVLSACPYSLASALQLEHPNLKLPQLTLPSHLFLLLQPLFARFLSSIHTHRARSLPLGDVTAHFEPLSDLVNKRQLSLEELWPQPQIHKANGSRCDDVGSRDDACRDGAFLGVAVSPGSVEVGQGVGRQLSFNLSPQQCESVDHLRVR